MKKLLALLLILAVGALAGLFFLQEDSPRGPGLAETPTAPEVPSEVEQAAPTSLEATPEPEPTPVAPAPVAEERVEVATTSDGEVTRPTGRLEGRVLLPAGAPADESLQVVALDNDPSDRDLYGRGGLLPRLHRGADELPSGIVAQAPVAQDGTFRIDLPHDDSRVWLAVDGRFVHTRRPVEVPPGADLPDLETRLGTHVHGRITLPPGFEPDPGAEEGPFAGLKVELGPDSSQFSMVDADLKSLFARGTFVDDEGRYEFRAVNAERACELAVSSEELADQRRDGLDLDPGRELVLDVTLAAGARLEGIVVTEAGAPVPDARVRVRNVVMWGMDGGSLADTRTDAEGRFVLKGVPPGKARIVAEANGWLDSAPTPLEVAEGQRVQELELTLTAGARLSGRVTWPDGRPAAGIDVEVGFDPEAMMTGAAMNMGRGADGDGETDDQGRFEISGLGLGPFMIRAEARVGSDEKRELELLSWDDDEDEEADPEVWYAERTGLAPDTEGIELVLVEPLRITGIVRDAGGDPVKNFGIKADSKGAVFFMPGESRAQNYEDEGGRFELVGLREGSWEIAATAKGFGPSVPVELTLTAGQPTEPVELTLVPAAEVHGVVLSPRGEPVPGAHVSVRPPNQKVFAQMTGRLDLPEAYAGESGEYVLRGLSVGSHGIFATHADYASSEVVNVELSAGSVAEDTLLTLRQGATLTGEVFGPEGDAAGGIQVIVQDSSTFEVIMRRTESDGTFRVENLRPGGWNVTAMVGTTEAAAGEGDDAASFQANMMEGMRFTQVEVKDGEEKHVVLGAPPEDPVQVSGTVLHAGQPAGSGIVSFFSEGSSGMDKLRMATLGADGRYEVQLDSPGRYLVSVQLQSQVGGFQQNNVEFSETVPEGEDHRLDLELPVGRISGQVRGPDKKPLSGARVTLTIDGGVKTGTFMGGQYGETTTDEAGRYTFDYLREGTYAVAAGGALFGGAFGTESKEGRVVRGGLNVKAGRAVDGVDFRLEEPGNIGGQVLSSTGSPVPNAALFVRDESGLLLERFSMTSTGPDGKFRYTGLAPGEYLVSARSSDAASPESSWVKVRSGETAEITVTLQPASMLIVVLVDSAGREGSFPGATLSVTDPEGREVNGMIAYAEIMRQLESGVSSLEQRLGPLAPGRYRVTATTRDGLSASKPVKLDGRSERRIKLRLR